MKRVIVIVLVLIGFAGMAGCGSSNTPPPSNVTISPVTAAAKTGEQVQFTATITSGTNSGFMWEVNKNIGGDLTNGTINVNGLYTAPGTVPKNATVTISAVSLADTTQSASAQVTISAGTPVTVSVSPSTASVPTGQTVQFTATVSNSANQQVAWAVNDIINGDAVNGTIDGSGVYTAPAAVPSTPTVTIKALSYANSNATATAQVTITPFTYISVAPSTVVVPAGGQQTFTATVNGQSTTATWSVSCQSQVSGACGSVSTAGVYTAPPSPPPGGHVTLTAASSDKDIHAGGAVITVEFSNGTLKGQYAFSMSGRNSTGRFTTAGSITFDGSTDNQGNGAITGGTVDVNSSAFSTFDITGGTYHVGSGGRGSAAVQMSNGATATWEIAVVNHAHGFTISSDAANSTASGALDLQDATQFNSGAVQGGYGLTLGNGPLAMAGALSADGAGVISQGLVDVNSAGAVSSNLGATGGYTAPSSSGRGMLTLSSSFGNQSFAYYVVDAAHLKLIQADAGQTLLGSLVKQAAGPFTNASFAGGFAFVLTGSSGGHPLGEGGIFMLDAAGNVSSGSMDINNNGTWQGGLAVTGSYSVSDATTGRTTVTLNAGNSTLHYVLYPQATGMLGLLQIDTDVAIGTAFTQTGSPYDAGSINGRYAFSLSGVDLASGEKDVTGQLLPNGGGALGGTLDISSAGTVSTGIALAGSYQVPASTGQGTAVLQTSVAGFTTPGFGLYLVDSGQVLFLSSGNTGVLTGTAQKQY